MTDDERRAYYFQKGVEANDQAVANGEIPAEPPPELLSKIARRIVAATKP
jgi:hypothetical protein